MRYVVSPDTVFTRLAEEEAVVLDLNTQRYFSINETGILIWTAMAEPVDLDEILDSLVRIYDIDRDELSRYVHMFLDKMMASNLVLKAD